MRIGIREKRIATMLILAVLFGSYLVGPVPVRAAGSGTIVFDFSHGQYASYLVNTTDLWLKGNLTEMGYTVVWALGGINASILENAVAFIAGSIYGVTKGYTTAEIEAIADWFNAGKKFMWIGYDSDYAGRTYINNNMTAVLEAVDSHVYGEPTAVSDAISNCGNPYRVVANGTSTNSYVASIVAGVTHVMMHGPTLVYGSNNATAPGPDKSPVALESTTIPNVYPLLYYGGNATILDSDLVAPIAHLDDSSGTFVAATLEIHAGTAGTGVLIVSGASPYGDYQPMYQHIYYTVQMDGYKLVLQGIDFGINTATAVDMTMTYVIAAIGIVVVVIIIAVVLKRK